MVTVAQVAPALQNSFVGTTDAVSVINNSGAYIAGGGGGGGGTFTFTSAGYPGHTFTGAYGGGGAGQSGALGGQLLQQAAGRGWMGLHEGFDSTIGHMVARGCYNNTNWGGSCRKHTRQQVTATVVAAAVVPLQVGLLMFIQVAPCVTRTDAG